MTKSGITRRIDELGRIVIPKEIRMNLGIRDGEPLELYIENNSIIIKKFSQVENIKDISDKFCNVISDICKIDLIISDREKVIVTSKKLKDLSNLKLNEQMKMLIDKREAYISEKKDTYFGLEKFYIMLPIVTSTDSSGLIMIISDTYNPEYLTYAKIMQKLIVSSLDVT